MEILINDAPFLFNLIWLIIEIDLNFRVPIVCVNYGS